MGWLIALAAVILFVLLLYLAKVKLFVAVKNGSKEFAVYLLGKKLNLNSSLSGKKEKKETEKENDKKDAQSDISTVKTLLTPIANAAKRVKRKLVISQLELDLAVATDDAAKTAVTFGAISAAAGMLCGFLKCNFKVKNDRINIYPDFGRETYLFDFKCVLYLRILDIILIGAVFLIDFLKKRREEKKKLKEKKKTGKTI